jgi:hypothetical protein
MKKNIIVSLIVSIGINIICFVTNLICSYSFHFLPLGLKYPGGDCIEYIGFGVDFLKIFALSMDSETGGVSYSIEFNFISLLIPLIVIFIITLIVMILISKSNKKRSVKRG